jgi:hypothetical protein
MKSVKPTPGEWKVVTTDENGARVEGISGVGVCWCGTNSTFHVNGESHTISTEEAKANGYLVAASKDLQRACNAALEFIQSDDCTTNGPTRSLLIQVLDDAVRKSKVG